ncbi:protein phosphatase regulator, partial [Tilletia horrida]
MLSAPSPYPVITDTTSPLPDDAQINTVLPSICVDYLSHNWDKDEQIWASWKAMTKSKNEITNGVRLENASWRTW